MTSPKAGEHYRERFTGGSSRAVALTARSTSEISHHAQFSLHVSKPLLFIKTRIYDLHRRKWKAVNHLGIALQFCLKGASRYPSRKVVSMLQFVYIYKDLMMSTKMKNNSQDSFAQIEVMARSSQKPGELIIAQSLAYRIIYMLIVKMRSVKPRCRRGERRLSIRLLMMQNLLRRIENKGSSHMLLQHLWLHHLPLMRH
jgi:hypothetical protein